MFTTETREKLFAVLALVVTVTGGVMVYDMVMTGAPSTWIAAMLSLLTTVVLFSTKDGLGGNNV